MFADPPTDTMGDRIEERIRNLLLGTQELAGIKMIVRGEPGAVPTDYHPFMVVFMEVEDDANSFGYGASTGVRNYEYTGYVSCDVLLKDATMIPKLPADRKWDVPSYISAKTFIQAARKALIAWGGPTGELEADPVVSFDGFEKTVEMITGSVRNGLASRAEDNFTNRSSFDFRIMTTRQYTGG